MTIELKTVGADPEFFIQRDRDGLFMPSSIITYGTKEFPQESGTKGFLIHKDNLSVEGNIPPSRNKDEFIASMKFIKEIINTLAEIKSCKIVCADSVKFDKRFLRLAEAEDFGCSGYYNAWDEKLEEISTPTIPGDKRVAGFHLHLGYEINNDEYSKEDIAKAIGRAYDIFVVIPSDKIKFDEFRRNNYGSYGSIRIKPYGVEVRALGGYFSNDEYLEWVYNETMRMFDWLNIEGNIEKILSTKKPHKYEDKIMGYKRIKNQLKIKEIAGCSI